MYIKRTCPLCGKTTNKDIDVEPDDLIRWRTGMLIQEALPYLNAEEREHIKTGICIKCWPSKLAPKEPEQDTVIVDDDGNPIMDEEED